MCQGKELLDTIRPDMGPSPSAKATKAAETRRTLLRAAIGQFAQHGVAATSVDAICSSAGVTKGGFFHHFKSKDQLVASALEAYVAWLLEALGTGKFRSLRDPRKRVLAFLEHTSEKLTDTPFIGCLLGVCALETPEHCEIHLTSLAGLLEILLDDVPGCELAREGLGEHFVAVLEGAIMVAKVTDDRAAITRSLMHFRDYVSHRLG